MPRGPSQEIQAHAFLAHASRDAAATLRSRSHRELPDLFDELWDLPPTDVSLEAELPKVFSPELTVSLVHRGVESTRTPEDTVELIRKLAAHTNDRQIAAILNDVNRVP